jgi:hypothetical protein
MLVEDGAKGKECMWMILPNRILEMLLSTVEMKFKSTMLSVPVIPVFDSSLTGRNRM